MLGSQPYVVTVSARARALELSCTCPYAADKGACKHLWALLLTCDTAGTLAPLMQVAGARHAAHFAVDADDLDADEDAFGAFVDGDGTVHDTAADMPPSAARVQHVTPPPVPPWIRVIDSARQQMQYQPPPPSAARPATWPANRRLVYIIDLDQSMAAQGVMLEVGTELRDRTGEWGEAKRFTLGAPVWFAAPDPIDRQIAEMLCGADEAYAFGRQRTTAFQIALRAFPTTLRTILETGRCRLRSSIPGLTGRTLRYDDGAPWAFRVRVQHDAAGAQQIAGILTRDGREMSLSEPLMLHASGYLIAHDALARFDHGGAFPLLRELRQHGSTVDVPEDISDLLARLYALPYVPALELPRGISVVESHDAPVPVATITARALGWNAAHALHVTCEFLYGARRTNPAAPAPSLFDQSARVLHHRHRAFERAALTRLTDLGAREEHDYRLGTKALVIARSRLTAFATTLARDGWQVKVEGVSFAAPGAIAATVSSGIDWFDLRGSVRYGDIDVPIASILEARRRGDDFVQIADGSMGLMPAAWLERLGPLLAAGDSVNGGMRYRRAQLSVLDALLATLPDANVDTTFERARAELSSFSNVAALDPPKSFRGTLREYQREGLGWLHFLQRFGLGGCLADDMGLGKTVQVLALLEGRRVQGHGPSLVVVPRSLVFNWLREAERFAPKLRMLDFSGSDRAPDAINAKTVDVVVITYGSLRRDAPMLADIEFDYVVLDEAQAIKNATTATAKASRLLRARHRLAMSGTPIENRIEELWSLLEFLNPGMLGASAKFSTMARPSATASPEVNPQNGTDAHALLARALRPVILRRTKERVARELPARIEQTLEVELEPKQRKYYDGIRKLAQEKVLAQVARQGIQKSQLTILEALLRLRQAACHPALIDPSKIALPSAKLDALVPALTSIGIEGHKTLVFSQFTAFLALLRTRLDAAGIRYEYLDGKTRDRQARVDRFQTDGDCPVFLISLKAGGHGLNLTAADYVYLLDPWWNPAVEAQAIDRAHRIGQTRHVMATRLVARDTIESKILQLQATKRELADAVLTSDTGGLASIGRQELDLLLG